MMCLVIYRKQKLISHLEDFKTIKYIEWCRQWSMIESYSQHETSDGGGSTQYEVLMTVFSTRKYRVGFCLFFSKRKQWALSLTGFISFKFWFFFWSLNYGLALFVWWITGCFLHISDKIGVDLRLSKRNLEIGREFERINHFIEWFTLFVQEALSFYIQNRVVKLFNIFLTDSTN